MSDILSQIVARRRERLTEARTRLPLAALKAELGPPPEGGRFIPALRRGGVRIIAEIKRRSPSRGVIRADFDPVAIARHYTAGGAAAISVLTEEDYFDGHLDYLRQARAVTALPLLRKDFIVDEYQIFEAAAA